MMGRQAGDQSQLFYLFNLEERIPARHLLRRINPIVTRVLADLREKLKPFYSETGRPSIDPELMLRMLIVGYCYGIRFDGKAPDEIDWSAPERRTRGVVEFHSGLEDQDPNPDRKPPKVISPTDPCSAWTAKASIWKFTSRDDW
jgi:Transposase domain (DUF772)